MKTSSTVALTQAKVSEPCGIRLHAASAVTLTLHCPKKTLSTFFFQTKFSQWSFYLILLSFPLLDPALITRILFYSLCLTPLKHSRTSRPLCEGRSVKCFATLCGPQTGSSWEQTLSLELLNQNLH